MTILFSFHTQQPQELSFVERVINVLEAQGHQIEKFATNAPAKEIDAVLTYTRQGLSQVNDLANRPDAPIIHLVNAENLEEEYPEDIVPVSKIIVVGNSNIGLFQKEMIASLFLPPVVSVPATTEGLRMILNQVQNAMTDETETKKLKILVDIKTIYTNGYSLIYRLAPLLNALAGSKIAVLYDEKPLLPLFNKNVSLVRRKETDIEKLLSESDLIIGSGESIYKGIALKKPCIVVGEQGYGGVITPQNFDWQLKTNFQGRIGGYLNEFIPENLLANDVKKTERTAKEELLKNAREIKELLDKAFDETKEQWRNCLSAVIQQYKQRKNNLRNTKIKVSNTFSLIAFSDEKFVLTYNATRKVHSDFGKAEADIINAFVEGCVVQDALNNCGYTNDADSFLEFINMLLDEKIVVIDE